MLPAISMTSTSSPIFSPSSPEIGTVPHQIILLFPISVGSDEPCFGKTSLPLNSSLQWEMAAATHALACPLRIISPAHTLFPLTTNRPTEPRKQRNAAQPLSERAQPPSMRPPWRASRASLRPYRCGPSPFFLHSHLHPRSPHLPQRRV
jgi:hypothetical protein